MADRQQDRPLAELLGALGAGIGDLADVISPLERAMAASVAAGEGAPGRAGMQNFDLLQQSVEALSKYVAELGRAVPGDVRVTPGAALAAVHLEALRLRLAGGPAANLLDAAPVRQIELF